MTAYTDFSTGLAWAVLILLGILGAGLVLVHALFERIHRETVRRILGEEEQ